MEKIKNIENQRQVSLAILGISILIIIFTIIHARAISNSKTFEDYIGTYQTIDYESYIANVNFFRNVIILYPILLIIYTIYSFSVTSFGTLYKIINGLSCLLSIYILQGHFIPRTIFAWILTGLFLVLFIVIMLRGKKIGKKL
ncbi:hypothetical protein [Anaerococcus sp. Marseille-Q5996]|uniref:hypothetical protein n=1 Tax=Anaerococcus sp. Marseille-Q5996 TaxID=2972769 RepID=UPI0021C9641A|nr:hypothetical protein [Anaerococcus sp. Marseille-Q5996]